MKLSTYRQDRTLLSEKSIKIEVPEYLKHFDDTFPIFNISDEEYQQINNREKSFSKSLIIDKIEYILDYDYYLYKKAKYNNVKTNVFNIDGTEIFDDIFDSIINDLILPLIPSDDNSYIQQISSNEKEDIQKIKEDVKQKLTTLLYNEKEEIESLFNRIKNRDKDFAIKYVILRLIKQATNNIVSLVCVGNGAKLIPTGILKNILIPLGNVAVMTYQDRNFTSIDDSVSKELLSHLYDGIKRTNGIGRSWYYHILYLLEKLTISSCRPIAQMMTHTYSGYSISRFIHKSMPNDHYSFELQNTVKNQYVEIEITDEEIVNILQNSPKIQEFMGILSEIAYDCNEHYGYIWKRDIDKSYETFIYNKRGTCWDDFEKEYSSRIMTLNVEPKYQLQASYQHLIAKYNTLGPNDVTITDELISELVLILRANYKKSKDNMDGLFETMYELNLIKSEIRRGTAYTPEEALDDAMRFLEPLLSDPNIINCNDSFNLKSKVRSILELDSIKKELNLKNPNGRTAYIGKFNLILVLNVLGVFMALEKIKTNKKTYIEEEIHHSDLLSKESGEWRKYIVYEGVNSKLTPSQLNEIKAKLLELGVKVSTL